MHDKNRYSTAKPLPAPPPPLHTAQDAGKGLPATQLLEAQPGHVSGQRQVKGWAQLCDENIVVEFPFAPDEASRKLLGRAAIYDVI